MAAKQYVLTEADLSKIDEMIKEAKIETTYIEGSDGSSVEVDDAQGTLRQVAKDIRAYIKERATNAQS